MMTVQIKIIQKTIILKQKIYVYVVLYVQDKKPT